MHWEPWNGEEGHLSPEARDQGMPAVETEPQAGEGLATENIRHSGNSGMRCGKSMGFKEELWGKGVWRNREGADLQGLVVFPVAFGRK